MKSLFICLFIAFSFSLSAQVTITESTDVTSVMGRFALENQTKTEMTGWRVQILSTTDRRAMEKAKSEFLSDFPNHDASWRFDNPYYRLRVGAFQNKIEAMKLWYEIKQEYPGAFPTLDDKITPSELLP